MRTAVITGASGFMAPHVAAALRSAGVRRIIGFSRSGPAQSKFDDWVNGSLDSVDVMRARFRELKPDVVLHLAGRFRGSEDELFAANLETTATLLDALDEQPECRVIIAGSAAEYGRPRRIDGRLAESDDMQPMTPYARSKAAATATALDHAESGRSVLVARIFNVIGPRMSSSLFLGAIAARLRDAIRSSGDPVVRVGNLEVARDFVGVDEAAAALARLAMHPDRPTGLCNVASGIGTPLTALTDALAHASGVDVKYVRDPELVRFDDPPIIVGDIGLQRYLCGFVSATNISASVEATWHAA